MSRAIVIISPDQGKKDVERTIVGTFHPQPPIPRLFRRDMPLRVINPPFHQRRIPPLVIYLLTEPQFQAYRRPVLVSLKVRRDDSELLGVPQVDVGRPAQSWVDVIDGRVGQDVLYPAEFV